MAAAQIHPCGWAAHQSDDSDATASLDVSGSSDGTLLFVSHPILNAADLANKAEKGPYYLAFPLPRKVPKEVKERKSRRRHSRPRRRHRSTEASSTEVPRRPVTAVRRRRDRSEHQRRRESPISVSSDSSGTPPRVARPGVSDATLTPLRAATAADTSKFWGGRRPQDKFGRSRAPILSKPLDEAQPPEGYSQLLEVVAKEKAKGPSDAAILATSLFLVRMRDALLSHPCPLLTPFKHASAKD